MYSNIQNVSRVIVNYSNGKSNIYESEDIFDAQQYMRNNPYSSKDVPVLYMQGA